MSIGLTRVTEIKISHLSRGSRRSSICSDHGSERGRRSRSPSPLPDANLEPHADCHHRPSCGHAHGSHGSIGLPHGPNEIPHGPQGPHHETPHGLPSGPHEIRRKPHGPPHGLHGPHHELPSGPHEIHHGPQGSHHGLSHGPCCKGACEPFKHLGKISEYKGLFDVLSTFRTWKDTVLNPLVTSLGANYQHLVGTNRMLQHLNTLVTDSVEHKDLDDLVQKVECQLRTMSVHLDTLRDGSTKLNKFKFDAIQKMSFLQTRYAATVRSLQPRTVHLPHFHTHTGRTNSRRQAHCSHRQRRNSSERHNHRKYRKPHKNHKNRKNRNHDKCGKRRKHKKRRT